ncbi:MAG TPA: aspartate transaminase, partial [Alcaligenaceae bacterium]|nr:aspartate transaminase [Alcaligenaceae bacterium]
EKHPNVLLMTDEIYEHFVYEGVKHACPAAVSDVLRDRTLLINGLSKSYAFTGWRIGYGAGPADLIKAINLLLSQSTSCASAISQAAAVVALSGPQECVSQNVSNYEIRRNLIVKLLNDIPGISCLKPDGAFYVFPSVEGLLGRKTPDGKRLTSDIDVMNYFLDSAKVATIDGTSYGLSPYLRLSFATSIETIERGCRAMAQAVQCCTD